METSSLKTKFFTRSLGCTLALLVLACATWSAFSIIYCTVKAILWLV